jgi:predicted methyltransferase
MNRHLLGALALLTWAIASVARAADPDPALMATIQRSDRSSQFVARDSARHPLEVLSFAGIKSAQSIVEIWPSGGYWSEILGPYIQGHGHYRLVLSPSAKVSDQAQIEGWQKRLGERGVDAKTLSFGFLGQNRYDLGAANSADVVLTFRNIHNWMSRDYADESLKAIFATLKPGGKLLVEEHRGRTDKPQDPKAEDGYVREDAMIEMAKKAGFVLVHKSEILANPRDIKDYPEGVWTLPPTLALGDKDREKYLAIGEADNFLLLFEKPKGQR